MRDPRASAERIDQVVALTRKLEDRILLDTPSAWADCRVLALEILELLDDEECSRTARRDRPDPMNREVVQRLLEAISACRNAGEQAELTHRFVTAERKERIARIDATGNRTA